MSRQKRLEFEAPSRRVVAKANDLVRARHTFSTVEQRIFVAMVAQLDRDCEEFEVQEVPIRNICSESNESDIYRRIDSITDRLLDQVVEIRTEDSNGEEESFVKYNVFSRCQYEKGSGVVQAKFTEDMRPFLLRLKEKFTLYLITVFLRLRSKYSTQIYELLKMRQGLHRLRMSVDEFRHSLALENKYERFSSLKKRVIEQARQELKEKADIYFTYDVIRDGNIPKEIEFYIHENDEVIRDLEGSASEIEEKSAAVGRSAQKGGRGPNIDPKAMFMSDLTQDEFDSVGRDEVDNLYREARSKAEEQSPDTDSEAVLEQMTYTNMKKMWEGE